MVWVATSCSLSEEDEVAGLVEEATVSMFCTDASPLLRFAYVEWIGKGFACLFFFFFKAFCFGAQDLDANCEPSDDITPVSAKV